MCLITEQTEPIILDKDYIVYKTGTLKNVKGTTTTAVFVSSIFEYEYVFNELYSTNMRKSNLRHDVVSYHDRIVGNTYDLQNYDVSLNMLCMQKNLTVVSEGFHFYLGLDAERLGSNMGHRECIVECIVPAGSEIYYDLTGLGVANNIKLVGILNK